MTKNKNKKSSEAAKQEAFKLSDGICYCKTPAVRLEFSYEVKRDGEAIATGKTGHGMVSKDLKPMNVKKEHPDLYRMFESALETA